MSGTPAPEALLIDFGGVLTTSVFDSFASFCLAEGLPEGAVRDSFARDEVAARLLVDAEEGRLTDEEFGRRFAARLCAGTGRKLDPDGLLERLNAGLRPEPAMVRATAAIRATGVTTVLVSNALGRGAYAWCDFDELFDHVVISAEVGVRKPSRRIFRIAAEVAGVPPERCVMVDDLEQNLAGARRVGMRTILHTDPATTLVALEETFGVALAVAS